VKVLFDTNVILDVMLDREPFAIASAMLLSKVETGEILGFLGATTVTTIHYLTTKVIGTEQAQHEIKKLITLFEIAPVNRTVLEGAITLKFPDFEDAVLHEAARHVGAQAIVTRDISGFKRATLAIYSPEELIKMIKAVESCERRKTKDDLD